MPDEARARIAGRVILQIVPELETGGAERTTIDIAAALAEAGARSLVASLGGRLVGELVAKGGIHVPFPAKTRNPLLMALNVQRLAALIRRENIALVHARSRAPAWVALGATRLTGTPFVTTYHGAYSGTLAPKVFYNSVMARGDVVIANSQFTADRIARLHACAGDRVRVIQRGTDFRRFCAAAVEPARVARLRGLWGVAPGERIALLPARLTGWKGQRVFIEAAAILAGEGLSGAKFILVGDDQGRVGYRAELESLRAGAGLGEIVTIAGHCDDMPAACLAASVVCVPSTLPEAFGRVAVEAQAMGVPVVVSDHGAAPETVLAPPRVAAGERTGWLVQSGDAAALASGLGAALSLDHEARAAIGARAIAHVARHFSVSQMCDATLAVYAELIGGGAGRAQRVGATRRARACNSRTRSDTDCDGAPVRALSSVSA